MAPSNGSSETNIYIAPDLTVFVRGSGLSQIYSSRGINATQLGGLQVTKYDGQDIWQYLNTTLLGQVGTYQDPAQRLNYMLASYQSTSGQFGRTAGAFTVTQDLSKDNFTLTVRGTDGQETDVTVPWVASYRGRGGFQFTSGSSL